MTNVGTKIKTLVKTVAILGCIACVIMFIAGCSAYLDDKDYIEYATVNGGASRYSSLEKAGNNALAGRTMMIYSAVSFAVIAVGSMPLYGFGVLVENSEYSAKTAYLLDTKLTNIEKKLEELTVASHRTNSAPSANTSSTSPSSSSFKLPEI